MCSCALQEMAPKATQAVVHACAGVCVSENANFETEKERDTFGGGGRAAWVLLCRAGACDATRLVTQRNKERRDAGCWRQPG